MALKSIQLVLVANTAQAAIVQGAGSSQFPNLSGTVQDPLPVLISNLDPALTIYVGGPGVLPGTGTPIGPGSSRAFALIGSPVSDIPWVIGSSGATPTFAVLCGRQ